MKADIKNAQRQIAVLTGGRWQHEFLAEINKAGHRSILLDKNPECSGRKYCDLFIQADCANISSCLEALEGLGIDGIIAEQTDVAVKTASLIAEALKLRFISPTTAESLKDKNIMRNICASNGLPVPKYRKVATYEEARDAARSIGYPVIIKPTDSQSSRGVKKVRNEISLKSAYKEAAAVTASGSVLVEELLLGIESSVESYVSKGKIEVLGISQKEKSPPPYSYDTKLVYPPQFPEKYLLELEKLNGALIKAFDIQMGFVHAEYIITPDGPCLIEIAGRGCGAGVTTLILPKITGYNIVRRRIMDALWEQPVFLNGQVASSKKQENGGKQHKVGLLKFVQFQNGRVISIKGIEEALKFENVIDISLNFCKGDVLSTPRSAADRHASIHIAASTIVDAEATLSRVLNLLSVQVET